MAVVHEKGSTPKYEFKGHENVIWGCVFLHDNVHIVSGSQDGTMRKWNCDTGRLVGKPWRATGGEINALALSPDGKIITCGRADGSVQQWTTDGNIISGWWGHAKAVRGSDDGTILIRKAKSGVLEVAIQPRRERWFDPDEDYTPSQVWSLSYSPLGDRIASGGSGHRIYIWNTKNGKYVIGPLGGGNVVTSLVWSSDGKELYSASDNFARVFDTITGELLHRYRHDDYLFSVALSPKNNVLACVGFFGIAQLWNTKSHKRGRSLCQDRKTSRCVSFSRDGRYLACGGYDYKLTVWVVNAPKPSHHQNQSEPPPHTNAAKSSSFPRPPKPSLARRFWNMISRHHSPVHQSVPQKPPKRPRRARPR
ncbi:quinon protein alcohol dehydrogenase-like superfamily [Suillus bovinus]|uniref:quinon protein alcohol dehydrogenase-like superfamily n=1 Tax=Suillus bovinus TaxID=48563 RepID=UPI001B872964|nr:quinon protein alcohol dehydrogenase-like superfamily [Suillus bovinus]KAG2138633.1 quinon protein alcohol dehydrogenase-like superfamily [Suillus bovinus]